MQRLHVSGADVGQRVLYSSDRDSGDVFSPARLRLGHVLEHHRPGVIDRFYGPGKHHCIVRFMGLEDEQISTGVGFDPDESGHYPGLLSVTEREWTNAVSAGWWSKVD